MDNEKAVEGLVSEMISPLIERVVTKKLTQILDVTVKHEREKLAAAKARITELEAERFTRQELDIIRQWYNAVQDVSPRYLNADDIYDDSVFLKVCALLKEKE